MGSAGGPLTGTDWYVSGSTVPGYHIGFDGHWDNVGTGDWEFDHTSRLFLDTVNQDWHTFEWRFKLSSTSTANDGVFQVWFDGVEQINPNILPNTVQAVDQANTTNSLVTAALPGFNLFVLFDNISGWGMDWGNAAIEGGILLNDLVISTERIGHYYSFDEIQSVKSIKSNVTVFPIPASSFVLFKTNINEPITLSIKNILGGNQKILENISLKNGFKMDVSKWAKGIYYCQILRKGKKVDIVKVVVQ